MFPDPPENDNAAHIEDPRIVIVGGPHTGKTTLGRTLAVRHRMILRHTDDLVGLLEWSEESAEVATWFDLAGPWIVEGVCTARALRKWLRNHPAGLPCDFVLWQSVPKTALTEGQQTMTKATSTIWAEAMPEFIRRGGIVLSETDGPILARLGPPSQRADAP